MINDGSIAELRKTYGAPDVGASIDGAISNLATAKEHLAGALGRDISFQESQVIEAPRWWYIPYGWIGCAGFIIDKADGYINQLGSCHSLDDCFWAHNRGIKYGYADLTIHQITNLKSTIDTLMKMGSRAPFNPIPNRPNTSGKGSEFWTREELEAILEGLPVTFSNQILWFTIPALRNAETQSFCKFEVTRGSWDAQFALT